MSKHTGGPWRVYPVGSCVPHYDVCPRVVADQPSGRSVDDPISDADAHLIAAAPELLEMVREFLTHATLLEMMPASVVERAQALVKKAEGGR